MRRTALALLAALGALASGVAAQADSLPPLYVRYGGGAAGRALADALRYPYVMRARPWNTVLRADTVFTSNVVVLNSDATVDGTVDGDLIVINGSINLTATSKITGRALAFGGNIYDATGAQVGGRREAFPAAHFDTVRTDRGLALDYRGPPAPPYEMFQLPGLYGVTVPLYDRVDGLSVGWFPSLTLRDSVLVVSPSVVYRSNLGLFDGALTVAVNAGGVYASVTAARATLTNDDWIQSDFGNSFMVFCCGKDFRNYWRAEYGEARVGYRWVGENHELDVWGGARAEKGSSVAAGGPWGITGTNSTYSMYRPNPVIDSGTIRSWLAGIKGTYGEGEHAIHASVKVEIPWATPDDTRWTQVTVDADGDRPVGRDQEILLRAHAILTDGDTPPPQRYGYLGGSGSLLTLGLLQDGGDELVWFEADYRYTFSGIHIPYTSSPSISLAYAAGSAGIGMIPTLTQNIGARVEIKPFRFDAFVDPSTGQWKTALLFWFVR